MIDHLKIGSPKRSSQLQTGWEGFFPYYAGYPEAFARTLLESARLKPGAVVLDPWNGSGTTTYTAAQMGLAARGFDLNPVMVIVSRARLLAPSEADSIEPLARDTVRFARSTRRELDASDPLTWWFTRETAGVIRGIERSIRRRLVGSMTITSAGTNFDRLSCMASTFYVALFSVCRQLVTRFQSSNPTWLRRPGESELTVWASRDEVVRRLLANLRGMASALLDRSAQSDLLNGEQVGWEIILTDTVSATLPPKGVDLILTSPPYCTRIDYTAATRIELAVLAPLLELSAEELSRRMIGSTRVPDRQITPMAEWGKTCRKFLRALHDHPSKASKSYYYKTHLDYFDKMSRSISNLASCLKPKGAGVFVVQDSYYKDVHNDLPSIIAEMGEARGLTLARREDFYLCRSMSGINPYARAYERRPGAVESVLCFRKGK